MSNKIYQFSNIPLVLRKQWIGYSQSTESRGDIQSYTGSIQNYSTAKRFVNSVPIITFSGQLTSKIQIDNPYYLEQRLRSLVGQIDSLICYFTPNGEGYEILGDDVPENCNCKIQWISAPALLKNVTVDNNTWEDVPSITLTFQLIEPFSPLNNFLWKYTNVRGGSPKIAVPATTQGKINALNCFPDFCGINTDSSETMLFKKINYDINSYQWDTEFWGIYANGNPCCENAGYGSDFINTGNYKASGGFWIRDIYIDPDIWGAVPSCLFAFGNTVDGSTTVNNTDYIHIENYSNNGSIEIGDATRMHIAKLSTTYRNKAAYRIIFGNAKYYRRTGGPTLDLTLGPYFVLDDTNSAISTPFVLPLSGPLFTYSGFFPVQLQPGMNNIKISTPPSYNATANNFPDKIAYSIIPRRH